NLQAKMDHLIQLLSTTSGTDDLFMLVQYSAIILRQLVSRGKDGKDNKGLLLTMGFDLDHSMVSFAECFTTFGIQTGTNREITSDFDVGCLTTLVEADQQSSPILLSGMGDLYRSPLLYLWEELELLEPKRRRLPVLQAGINFHTPRKPDPAIFTSLREMEQRREALLNGLIVHLAYPLLTLHLSLSRGLYGLEMITGICGFIAAVAQL
ncbi:hypothetical protein MJO29_008058, partial [Puccinia striiformis f. sp. tritici]